MWDSCIVVFSFCAVLASGSTNYEEATVYMDKTGKPTFVSGKMDKSGAAYGYYNNTLLTTGWGVLEIKAGYNDKTTNNDLMYAAGFMEGVFSAEQMWLHYNNMKPVFLNGDHPEKLKAEFSVFFNKQEKWTNNMIKKNIEDPYWRQVSYIMAQYQGLYDGYKSVAKPSWDQSKFVVQFLNAVGDLIDLQNAIDPSSRPDFSSMTHQELVQYRLNRGHCSSLVKVLGAYENLYMSHSSWFVYSGTMRIYKHYHFNIQDSSTASKDMSFSSYAGYLESLDDFYLMGSGIVLLQTTNLVFNMSLYDLVTPESLLAWQRVRLANNMATSGYEWYKYFKRYNSGTYNNQYMVIDLKRVELNKDLHDDTLWVVEQIPGRVTGADQTPILRTGYWPSYNVPFYEDIYNMSGYPEVVKQKGPDESYQLAPRAKIFRRDQGKVTDMDTMKHLLRYNDYEHDPYSEGNACDTICCRGDLLSVGPTANGCYDTKVSDMAMALDLKTYAISGPTLGDNLKPFSWTGIFNSTSHEGLPQTYNFDWMTMKPIL